MEINATLIGQLITFGILVWFTMKYVWPPITKAMAEREKKIAKGLEDATRSKRELEAAEHKALSIIHDAKHEASEIIKLSHKRSAQIVDEAKGVAREEGNRIVEHAKSEIVKEVNQARGALRNQLGILAVAGAEKIIKKNLDVSAQTKLLDELVAEI